MVMQECDKDIVADTDSLSTGAPNGPAGKSAVKEQSHAALYALQMDGDLAGIDPEYIGFLDRALHGFWGLGRNIVLVWAVKGRGIEALVIPHYRISEFATLGKDGAAVESQSIDELEAASEGSQRFIEEILSRKKHVDADELARLADLFDVSPKHIRLPFMPGDDVSTDAIENVVKRYGISYVEDRAVALFDIVGFSLFSPLEQVTQLNSLAYSVNAAYSKMLSNSMDINFARTTTGDGFYIWNRDRSLNANISLYHFTHLVLADNAIARGKARANTTPQLRASFHVGGHYEFYQSEGLSPTVYSYIVGDVTIELARMIDRALPGQVLVGDFWVPMPDWDAGKVVRIDTCSFIERTRTSLENMKGLVLAGDRIDSIQCYLTGEPETDGAFGVHRYRIEDKHGRSRNAFNAKINIYRKHADPIFLGVQTRDLDGFEYIERTSVTPESGLDY